MQPTTAACHRIRLITLVIASCFASTTMALTDIATAPLANSPAVAIKPNIMFIFDDSGSMDLEFMPEDIRDNYSKNCFKNHLYNRIYYNPSLTYSPPKDADGNSYPNATFTDAKKDGFDTSASPTTVNLNSAFKAYVDNPYYSTPPDALDTKAYYYNADSSVTEGSCAADNKYTKVEVSDTSSEAQNFANWYSYYRTRLHLMRTSAGNAFTGIGNTFRIGFATISNTSGADGDTFLNIRDFDTTQKASFYTKLYTARNPDGTPLLGALSRAGRYFANKLSDQTDPIQYSCQQNFTILTTDGYWNQETVNKYKPYQMDGSTLVGNQDGDSTLANIYRDQWQTKAGDVCGGQTGGTGVSDTLADVAMYYYKTDLRNSSTGNCTGILGTDICENNVPKSTKDDAAHQHMTTFTLGLGVNGLISYASDYETGGSADFNAIKAGSKNWPSPIGSSCEEKPRIDDLWHAAVNGRGTYFSAKNPASLVSGLSKALSGVTARKGSASAAATSNLEPVAGDNYVYVALYRTVKWDGDLQAYQIDPDLGTIVKDSSNQPIVNWSAQAKLDTTVSGASAGNDDRTIYLYSSSGANKRRTFEYGNLTATEKTYFDSLCTNSKLTQCSDLSSANQTLADNGTNVIKFLRGQSTYEDETSKTNRLFRDREHVLGDIVNAMPVYVKKPPFDYVDSAYDTFKTAQATRAATVYAASNDGMLHAFDAGTGVERWAYIPTMLLPKLYKLADFNYGNNHDYFVDGSPTVADIYAGGAWKTIIIGGLNSGGRGYYALDVTDPTTPKGLWEFSDTDDADLGLTFGNPIVGKNADGDWVVFFTSGYNNVSSGDGEGHLYVLNADSGSLLAKIDTGAGSTDAPSGLARINAWVDGVGDNTVKQLYGGDLAGNLWRFGSSGVFSSTQTPVQLAEFKVGSAPQPITAKPELGIARRGGATYSVVYVGTGRYLGTTDRSDTSQQTIYGIKDAGGSGIGLARQGTQLVTQTMTQQTTASGAIQRVITSNDVDWTTKNGWMIDLNPGNNSPGERVNIDMQLQSSLEVITNVPDDNSCNVGGYAWAYSIDKNSGSALSTALSVVGTRMDGNALAVGFKLVRLANGKIIRITTLSDGTLVTDELKSSGTTATSAHRVSWRELMD